MIDYIQGIAVILAFIGYLIVFNKIFEKLTGETPDDIFQYVMTPVLITLISILVFMVPYIIGKAI